MACCGHGARLETLAGKVQSRIGEGVSLPTRAARSVLSPRAYSRPRGDRRACVEQRPFESRIPRAFWRGMIRNHLCANQPVSRMHWREGDAPQQFDYAQAITTETACRDAVVRSGHAGAVAAASSSESVEEAHVLVAFNVRVTFLVKVFLRRLASDRHTSFQR